MTEKIDPFRWFGVREIDEQWRNGWEVYDTASKQGVIFVDTQTSYYPENHAEGICDDLNDFYIDLLNNAKKS
jgi:hypothetical protein